MIGRPPIAARHSTVIRSSKRRSMSTAGALVRSITRSTPKGPVIPAPIISTRIGSGDISGSSRRPSSALFLGDDDHTVDRDDRAGSSDDRCDHARYAADGERLIVVGLLARKFREQRVDVLGSQTISIEPREET